MKEIFHVLQRALHLKASVQDGLGWSKAILIQVDHCGILPALCLLTLDAVKCFNEVVLLFFFFLKVFQTDKSIETKIV